jgi:hypothetical protein
MPGTGYDEYCHSNGQVASHTQSVRARIYTMPESGRKPFINYARVFGILRKTNCNGFISLIYEGSEDKFKAIPRGVRLLRSLGGTACSGH